MSTYLGLWQEPQTIQTTYPFNTWHNVAFNYKIFKDKINISLRALNYTEKTHDFKNITKDKNFYNTNINRQPRRAVNNDDILTKPAAPGGN